MDFAVLVKAVPDLDKLRYDPDRKTMVREGAELFLNPFDLRAIRVALDIRRPGESVRILSMGPPTAGPLLREALALGADRVTLITDRALAGSDTLVTARVLTRALELGGHDIVLGGRWTTDSETGQVGPEVAALLGVPVVSGARAIVRDPELNRFDVTVDAGDGWSKYRLTAPFVATVGEKITKVRRATPAESSAVRAERLEHVDVAGLGLSAEAVGLGASPTVVERLVDETPSRSPRVFAEGSAGERVAGAVAHLEALLDGPLSSAVPLPGRTGPLPDREEVLVLVTNESGLLDGEALPVVSEVRRTLPPAWPSAVWVGPPPTPADREALGRAGALRLRFVSASVPISSVVGAWAMDGVLAHAPASAAGVFLANDFGRDVAGQVAARNGLGLTGDAVGLLRGEDGEFRWRKPSFGGGVVADIRSRTRPSLATVRAGVFVPGVAPDPAPPVVDPVPLLLRPDPVEHLGSARESESDFGDLPRARVVVSVGMGLGSPSRLAELTPTLSAWGAALAATRRVVDSGWVSRQRQVGLTGRSLAPELVVCLGVSGQANHVIGWKRARAALAVNPDPQAPVFRWADVGIVGRWEEVLPGLTDALAPIARRLSAVPPTSGSPGSSPPK